jgi:signal transduction histidine kinase
MDELESLRAEVGRLKAEVAQTKAVNQKYLQNVAHQLTAPLGSIKWSIEALKDERIPISRKGILLSSIYSQATILVHLIKNFALMSNLEADHELGQFREKPEPVDIMRLAINLANDFQPQAHELDIKIIVDNDSFKKVFGTQFLEIEKNLVAQAISNIIENAVKYADRETTVSVSAFSRGEQVGIKISSFGIPITNEEKANIFERGFRGNSAKQKVAAGTGIGLYLALRVMKFHGGSIDVETEGKHSCIILIFPRSRVVSGR